MLIHPSHKWYHGTDRIYSINSFFQPKLDIDLFHTKQTPLPYAKYETSRMLFQQATLFQTMTKPTWALGNAKCAVFTSACEGSQRRRPDGGSRVQLGRRP
jgi:hypothetical protein